MRLLLAFGAIWSLYIGAIATTAILVGADRDSDAVAAVAAGGLFAGIAATLLVAAASRSR